MPYYIYKISSFPIRQLQRLEEHAAFGAASARAKTLRGESGEDAIVKVIFADNELHAEDLLSQVRSAQPNPADD